MVAKKIIIKIMQEVLGEYITNIPPSSLSVFLLRGKIKLENVQLDGDLIGSHVLSAMGLSGFAVLSCTAKSLRGSIPWGKLEKEPTVVELSGVQLICVPLLPSNATRVFGAGDKHDPRCTLRTRVKRSALARFERNFFGWRIPGEGPMRPEERKRRRRRRGGGADGASVNVNANASVMSNMNMSMNWEEQSQPGSVVTMDMKDESSVVSYGEGTVHGGAQNENAMSDGQKNVWRQNLVARLTKNLQITFRDIHVRCEVGENSLDSGQQEELRPSSSMNDRDRNRGRPPKSSNGTTATSSQSSLNDNDGENHLHDADSRSFAFGMNVDSVVFKSANSNWETGRNVDWSVDDEKHKQHASTNANENTILEPEKRYYVLDLTNLAMYWDDSPPILISESHAFQFSEHQLSQHKVLTIVRKAMEKLKDYQDPGSMIQHMLETGEMKGPTIAQMKTNAAKLQPSIDHLYLLEKTTVEVRVEITDIPNNHEPNICSAEILPCQIDLYFSPEQLRQRRLLEYTMIGQQRLDTMLHQRPVKRPTEDPRGWWRYVISCVVTCPNRRSWRDVKTIVSKRAEYIHLVEKKHMKKGLNEQESKILLELEDALPIETLLAFHLIALRNVVERRERKLRKRRNRRGDDASAVGGQDDDLNSVAGGESVFSGMSFGRRRRSKSKLKKQNDGDDSVAKMNRIPPVNDDKVRHPALPRLPLSKKIPKMMRKRNPPPKENMSSMRVLKNEEEDDDYDDESITESIVTMDISEAESHIDFGGFVPGIYDEEIVQKPPMIRIIRGKGVVISATLLDRAGGDPVLIGTLDSTVWAKHTPMEGVTFLFDIIRVDVIDCTEIKETKVLTFDSVDDIDDGKSIDDVQSAGDTSDITLATELLERNSFDDDNVIGALCRQLLEDGMPLPPRGIVCRLLIDINARGRSGSFSAKAATLTWKTGYIKAFMDSFFPDQSQEARSVLRTQLRNAATPLALKTQVALVSPRALSIDVNIDAPKIWFPVSQNATDGALFVDSGRLNISLSKPELLANMQWSMNVNGTYANFRQSKSAKNIYDYSGSDGIPILEPFDFVIEEQRSGEGPAYVKTKDGFKYGQSKRMKMSFTAITLSLVDVEVLAMAIGRWYAAEISSLKSQSEKKDNFQKHGDMSNNINIKGDGNMVQKEVLLSIDSVELFLQGQATKKSEVGKRTYRIQVMDIKAKHCNEGDKGYSSIRIGDANIVKDSSIDTSIRKFEASNELRHKLLTCSTPKLRNREPLTENSMIENSAITVAFLRDRKTLSNDLDISFGYLILRLTPMMLTDSSVAIERIIESTKIMTKEMERRVHVESRQILISESRDEIMKSKSVHSIEASAVSSVSLNGYAFSHDQSSVTLNRFDAVKTDSMFVVKATVKEAVLQIGWDEDVSSLSEDMEANIFQSVVQISFSILLMFQSTENFDGSGKRVIHASFDNFWASMIKDFAVISIRRCKPIIDPFACEFRSVSVTTNYGEVIVSQDYAIDSDSINFIVEKSNFIYLIGMFRDFIKECKSLGSKIMQKPLKAKVTTQTQNKGKGSNAITMGFQFQPWSIIILSKVSPEVAITQPLLKIKGEANGKFDGYTCALSGESRLETSFFFYSKNIDGWVHLMESLPLSIELEYQPDDVVFKASFDNPANFNITSEMLDCVAREVREAKNFSKTPRVESVKKRVKIMNDSGVNFVLSPMRSDKEDEKSDLESVDSSWVQMRSKSIKNGSFEYVVDTGLSAKVGLILNENDDSILGVRNPVLDLPLHSTVDTDIFYLLPDYSKKSRKVAVGPNTEPIVEYCIQNQRLRTAFNNISTLDAGGDLLSSQIWSPSDQIYNHGHGNHWLHPYLTDDVPEWSDTTFSLRLDQDKPMLPDNHWVWANDWEVELSGVLDKEIDTDGWDYAEDFNKFTRKKRFYREGDTCRRRKWTRTRLMKKQLYDRIKRPIPLVWSATEKDGCREIRIRSHIRIKNKTKRKLSLFGYKYSWDGDKHLGDMSGSDAAEFVVPIQLSSITHLCLGIMDCKDVDHQNCPRSKRILILPTSHSCNRILREKIYLDPISTTEELLSSRSLHFLITVDCLNGLVDILIEPVIKIVNLLPCPVQFRLIDAARQASIGDNTSVQSREGITQIEEIDIAVGAEACSLNVDPSLNPSISFRMPGYRWSSYQRIVNRSFAERSWRANKYDKALRHESIVQNHGYASTVAFESLVPGGDPLKVILEVSSGHCPTLTIYAQYWVVDLSEFGLRFCDGASDLIRTNLVLSKDRRSYSKRKDNIDYDGHEWAVGKSGVSIYFTEQKKIAVTVDLWKGNGSVKTERTVRSGWSRLLDISNVMPKTVFSVDELNSTSRYDLCYDVTTAPSAFSRTKVVRLFSRFHVMNLSSSALYVMQEGCPGAISFVQPEGSIPFHWDDSSKPTRIQLSTNCVNWSQGSVPIDKVGITSIKLHDTSEISPVLQVEVRLAAKEHNGAVAILIWNSKEKSQPLYILKNLSNYKIICCQQKKDLEKEPESQQDDGELNPLAAVFGCAPSAPNVADYVNGINCGFPSGEVGLISELSQWILDKGDEKHFGFDYPLREHVLEWIVPGVGMFSRETIELDTIGSNCTVSLPNGSQISCLVKAEGSSKVVEFTDFPKNVGNDGIMEQFKVTAERNSILSGFLGDDLLSHSQHVAIRFKISLPGIAVSLLETRNPDEAGREILFATVDQIALQLGQSGEGYHELELKVAAMQIDNHLFKTAHPVLFSFLRRRNEPVLHVSVVRKIRKDYSSSVYKYAAIRLLDTKIALDRSTTETIAKFFEPFQKMSETTEFNARAWISDFTQQIREKSAAYGLLCSDYSINTDRLYIEELHIHPTRITFTFAQDWKHLNSSSEGPAFLQHIRLVPSITDASLILTSFVVSRSFESPSILKDIIQTHYVSQVIQHFFSLIGSLAILTGPADFLANIGTGVRDFFYEPINGLVHGPAEFFEGLENGSLSLVRGVFVGVVRGAANVTGVLNSNLVNLTDDSFIAERNAYQRSLLDLNSSSKPSKVSDILALAGASIAHGVKSGAKGLYNEPMENFNRQGAAGFVKGVGQALVKAVVKPIVGIGDGAILMLQHVTEATDEEEIQVAVPKRLRRALLRKLNSRRNSVLLIPYDEKAAVVQKLVTDKESLDDAYMSHIYTEKYLLVASEQFLSIIERRTEAVERLRWEEISHFHMFQNKFMHIVAFTTNGLKPKILELETPEVLEDFSELLSIQDGKMTNVGAWSFGIDSNNFISNGAEYNDLVGVQTQQTNHVFGSINYEDSSEKIFDDEIQIVEDCFARVKFLSGETSTYFSSLDEEAWSLINSWRKIFVGIKSKHCLVAGFINGTGHDIQVTSTILLEGGSPCCQIPSRDYDELNNILKPGGAIILFSWGVPPSLSNEGRIHLAVETNIFTCNLLDRNSPLTSIEVLPGQEDKCIFVEKSISDWWAKYWVLIK